MKYLIVLGLLGALLWWKWHASQTKRTHKPPVPPQPPAGGVPMVACPVCQLNVPEPEAVVGLRARYCCENHRARAEG